MSRQSSHSIYILWMASLWFRISLSPRFYFFILLWIPILFKHSKNKQHVTGLEPVRPGWKPGMLTTDITHALIFPHLTPLSKKPLYLTLLARTRTWNLHVRSVTHYPLCYKQGDSSLISLRHRLIESFSHLLTILHLMFMTRMGHLHLYMNTNERGHPHVQPYPKQHKVIEKGLE